MQIIGPDFKNFTVQSIFDDQFIFTFKHIMLNSMCDSICVSKLPFTFDKKLDILQKNKSKVESNLKFCPF